MITTSSIRSHRDNDFYSNLNFQSLRDGYIRDNALSNAQRLCSTHPSNIQLSFQKNLFYINHTESIKHVHNKYEKFTNIVFPRAMREQ